MGSGGRGGQGLYQKEPLAHPNFPNPADLKEPLLLLRADMAARVGQAGNSGPGFSPLPIPPLLSSLLGLTLTPSSNPRTPPPRVSVLPPSHRIQAEMDRHHAAPNNWLLNSPQTTLIQLPKHSPKEGGKARQTPVAGVTFLLSPGDKGQGRGGGGRGLLGTWTGK